MSAPRPGLFVYGTLLPGEANDGFLAALPGEPATAKGRLYLHPAGYPVLVLDAAAGPVEGMLFREVDESLLRVLDVFEGVDAGLYDRVVTEVIARNGPRPAWAYAMTPATVKRRRLALLPVSSRKRFARR
jgi:gamma-glutamylcyclotransferase (GGCT)/AIG2-like uncharacterized protein YtfP